MYVGRADSVKVSSQSGVQWMDSDQDLDNSNIGKLMISNYNPVSLAQD